MFGTSYVSVAAKESPPCSPVFRYVSFGDTAHEHPCAGARCPPWRALARWPLLAGGVAGQLQALATCSALASTDAGLQLSFGKSPALTLGRASLGVVLVEAEAGRG